MSFALERQPMLPRLGDRGSCSLTIEGGGLFPQTAVANSVDRLGNHSCLLTRLETLRMRFSQTITGLVAWSLQDRLGERLLWRWAPKATRGYLGGICEGTRDRETTLSYRHALSVANKIGMMLLLRGVGDGRHISRDLDKQKSHNHGCTVS